MYNIFQIFFLLKIAKFKVDNFRSKLREYEVTQIQNYDNPMFTGQHTPAERYGSIQNPWTWNWWGIKQ